MQPNCNFHPTPPMSVSCCCRLSCPLWFDAQLHPQNSAQLCWIDLCKTHWQYMA